MESSLHYIELESNPIRFEAVSNLTNVFFDDSNRQVFAVRSGGATGISVKGPTESESITFCMEDKGPIRSIKFSPDNKVLAVQRVESAVEFINFNNNQPNLNDIIVKKAKNAEIYGFVWIHAREVALISSGGIELHLLIPDKRQMKSIKSINITINWFHWCSIGMFALVSSNNGTILTPIIIKQGTITKLPRLELESDKSVLERDVTLGQLYGTSSIMILRQTAFRLVEVVIYMLNGPGLAPKKSHILKLGLSGRFAMNVVDDLIIVHHQASSTSLLFDIALTGEVDPVSKVVCHTPLVPGRSIKPFSMKLPSISLDSQTMNCDLYSKNWVLFQPNIVIDIRLGCVWYVHLKLQPLQLIVADKVRLVEFLLQRSDGKSTLLSVLKNVIEIEYNGTMLPIIENIFDKINNVYKIYLDHEIQSQMGTPSTVKVFSTKSALPRILIDQDEMCDILLTPIVDTEQMGKILMIYLQSLHQNKIAPQEKFTQLVIQDMIKRKQLTTLQMLFDSSMLYESKNLACILLSLGHIHPLIDQMAMDMFSRMNANDEIIEVLIGKGKVIEALRLANQVQGNDVLVPRKYLEAAQRTDDPIIFHSVYHFFQQRNLRLRNSVEFKKSDQCGEYVQFYHKLFHQTPKVN